MMWIAAWSFRSVMVGASASFSVLRLFRSSQTWIVSSPARRTHQTAKLFAAAFDAPPRIELWADLGPGAPSGPILEHLRRTVRAPHAEVLLVGHQPGLEQLIGLALTGDSVPLSRFSKAGAAALEFSRAIRPGAARLEWLVTRSQLSAIGK